MSMLSRWLFCIIKVYSLLITSLCYAQERISLVPFERVIGINHEKMVDFILVFPKEQYKIYHVPTLGMFYLDAKKDLIKNILRKGIVWEPQIRELILTYVHPESTVLDVGAHIGTHTLTMSQKVGPKGRVLAFEPQPKIFRELFLNLMLNGVNNVDFYPAAVGDHEATIELTQLCNDNEAGTSLILQPRGTGEFAPLITIDSLQLNDVSFMKIDVEVMENFVLEGAKDTIARCHPVILIEIRGDYWLENASPEIRNEIFLTISKLQNMGYNVTRISGADFLAVPTAS